MRGAISTGETNRGRDSSYRSRWLENLLRVTPTRFRVTVINNWFARQRTRDSRDHFNKLIFAIGLVNAQHQKEGVALRWMERHGSVLKAEELKTLLEILNIAQDQDEECKGRLIESWFVACDYGCDAKGLVSMLQLEADDQHRTKFMSSWFKSNKSSCTTQDFVDVLRLEGNADVKRETMTSWVEIRGASSKVEDLRVLFDFIDQDEQKELIAATCLAKSKRQTYDKFVYLVQNDLLCQRYDFDRVCEEFVTYLQQEISMPEEDFVKLCQDLYPEDETSQCELFEKFMLSDIVDELGDEKTVKELALSFIGGLSDNDSDAVLNALNAFLNTEIRCGNLEVLEVAKRRMSDRYKLLTKLLRDQNWNEALSKEGLAKIEEEFSGDLSPDITLADIFAYYDIKGQITQFRSFLRVEVLDSMTGQFVPSSKRVYVLDAEYQKLAILFGSDRNLDLALPMVRCVTENLSEIFGERFKSERDGFQIESFKFGKSQILATLDSDEEEEKEELELRESKEEFELEHSKEEKIKEITEEFKRLFKAESSNKEEVADFFEEILNVKISDNPTNHGSNRDKLYDFFVNNKTSLAVLFEREGGVDSFSVAIGSIADGCVANIATKAKEALYSQLFADIDRSHQILYRVFNDQIAVPILNSGGDHLTRSITGINPLDDRFVNAQHLSPNGLAVALQREFIDRDGRIIINPWDFIREPFEARCEAIEAIDDAGRKSFQTKWSEVLSDFEVFDPDVTAKMASCVVLRKTVPSLLENRFVRSYYVSREENLMDKLEEIEKRMEEVLSDLKKSPDRVMHPNEAQQMSGVEETKTL